MQWAAQPPETANQTGVHSVLVPPFGSRLLAHRSYRELEHERRFWRTKSGLEVDYVTHSSTSSLATRRG